MDAGCVADDGRGTNFVSYKNENQSFEMTSKRDHKMLMKCEEELKLLEKMLIEPESNQVADKKEKCSSSENVEPEIKYNLQFNVGDDELTFQTSNNKFQPETRLDIEIEKIRELMEKIHKSRYCKIR